MAKNSQRGMWMTVKDLAQGDVFDVHGRDYMVARRHSDGSSSCLMVNDDGDRIEGQYYEFCHWQKCVLVDVAKTSGNKKGMKMGEGTSD
jgi:hypothetical protein